MNHRYSSSYTPVFRHPFLFKQNTLRSSPTQPQTNNYYYYPSPYAPQSYSRPQYIASPLPNLPQSYPSYLTLPKSPSSPQFPISSYASPTFSYAPTISSKGLSLILIATLILVALDLVLVRPQKFKKDPYRS